MNRAQRNFGLYRSERHCALESRYPPDTQPSVKIAHPKLLTETWFQGCTGNCMQGRMCDCVPNVPDPTRIFEPKGFWATLRELLFGVRR